jgi:hypothetical protein
VSPSVPASKSGLERDAAVPDVIDRSGQNWFGTDALRLLVPIVALVVALVAAITQPSFPIDLLLVAAGELELLKFRHLLTTQYFDEADHLASEIAIIDPWRIVSVVLAQRTLGRRSRRAHRPS